MFADYVMLLGESEEWFQRLEVDSIRKRWNLKLNVGKSKVIVFQRNTGMECRVCMIGQEMEIV